MNCFSSVVFLLLFSLQLSARNKPGISKFYFTQLPKGLVVEAGEDYQWAINGVKVSGRKDTFEIQVHYPAFDTVVLSNEKYGEKRVIITRFDCNHLYELRPLSYVYDVDILDAQKAGSYKTTLSQHTLNDFLWDEDLYGVYDSLAFYKETGKVVFEIKNAPADTLFGAIYGDMKWRYGNGTLFSKKHQAEVSDPLFLNTSGFCYHVKIGSGKEYMENDIYMEHDHRRFYTTNQKVFVFDQQLLGFECRFFNRETLLVTYDAHKKTTKLKLKS